LHSVVTRALFFRQHCSLFHDVHQRLLLILSTAGRSRSVISAYDANGVAMWLSWYKSERIFSKKYKEINLHFYSGEHIAVAAVAAVVLNLYGLATFTRFSRCCCCVRSRDLAMAVAVACALNLYGLRQFYARSASIRPCDLVVTL
jgi:uncharacterized membrane protein